MSSLKEGKEWTGRCVLREGSDRFTLKGIHGTDTLKGTRTQGARCALQGEWRRGAVGLFGNIHPGIAVAGTTPCVSVRATSPPSTCRSVQTCTPWYDCCRYHALCVSQSDLTALNMDLPPPRNYVPLGVDRPKPTPKTSIKSVSTPTSTPQHGPPQTHTQDLH